MKYLYHHRTQGKNVEGVHIRGIVKALRKKGRVVDILSFPNSDPEKIDSVAHITKKNHPLKKLISTIPEPIFEILELCYNLLTFVRLVTHFFLNKPDRIYERYSLFLFMTVWLSKRFSIPIVLEINDSALVDRVRPLYFKKIAQKIEHWTITNSSGLVFISKYFQELMETKYTTLPRYVISPNAVDMEDFIINHDNELKTLSDNLKGSVVCGFVGAFLEWHGIHLFVNEIAPKLKKIPNLKLLLLGDGPTYKSVASTIDKYELQNQIILPGRVAHIKVPNFINLMDFSILPNSNEYGSPMKLFELMALEVGVVCPSYGPIVEVIENNKTGWLFKPGDIHSAVNMVCNLSQDLPLLYEVGKAANKYIKDNRQWFNNVDQLESLYELK